MTKCAPGDFDRQLAGGPRPAAGRWPALNRNVGWRMSAELAGLSTLAGG